MRTFVSIDADEMYRTFAHRVHDLEVDEETRYTSVYHVPTELVDSVEKAWKAWETAMNALEGYVKANPKSKVEAISNDR